MTRTVVSSATREVVIGDDQPFVIIGERINPTGRKLLVEEMEAGDFSRVERDTIAQVEAGAQMLDVNAGIPLADEPAILAKTIKLVQSLTDLPLSIDSSIVEALEAGLAVYQGKPLLNSVTGEEERLERVLPLVKKYGCAVVAISNDETGISMDPDVRFAVAKRIVERAADHGIPREDIVVDPLLMPIGALAGAGRQVFRILGRLRDELKVNSTCGASNVSFGLPNREGINGAFLNMAIASGLTSAITNPVVGGCPVRGHGERRADGQRPGRHPLDPPVPGRAGRWRGRPPARQPDAADQPSDGRPGAGPPTSPAWTSRGSTSRPHADGGPMADDARPRADPQVIFTPSGRRGRVPAGTTVLDAARSLGVDIDAVCGGRGICGRCAVTPGLRHIRQARHHVRARTTSPSRTQLETAYREEQRPRRRPAVVVHGRVLGDAVIDVPPESQVHRQVVRKDLAARAFEMDPVVRLHTVDVTEPDLATPTGDLGRLFEALRREWGLTDLRADLSGHPGAAADPDRPAATA